MQSPPLPKEDFPCQYKNKFQACGFLKVEKENNKEKYNLGGTPISSNKISLVAAQ